MMLFGRRRLPLVSGQADGSLLISPRFGLCFFIIFCHLSLTGWELCSDINETIYYIIVTAMDHTSFLNLFSTNMFLYSNGCFL